MSFKRVGDIMIRLEEYPHLPHWFTLRQALAELKGAQYEVGEGQVASPRSALVFDEEYRLLGLLRRRDIMRGIVPRYLASEKLHFKAQDITVRPDPDLWALSFDKTIKALREQSECKVSEVMQPIVTTLHVEDPLMKAVSQFVEHDTSLIPVLRDGKVAGVVNTVCVCHELAQLIL
jgi:CBS-domain-containing membrane protein